MKKYICEEQEIVGAAGAAFEKSMRRKSVRSV